MTTEIIPLGTASAIPTRERHLSATVLRRGPCAVLFDCGEGTQRQLLRAGVRPSRLEAVCITHLHGDHFYGLMGLLSTLALQQREAPLTVVGPRGMPGLVQALPGLGPDELTYPVRYVELEEGFGRAVVYEGAGWFVEARPVAHRMFTVGFRFQERPLPGRLDAEKARALGVTDYAHFRALKAGHAVTPAEGRTVLPEEVVGPERPGVAFAYVTDTRPCEGGLLLARGVDLLYHEATFGAEHHARAVETGHATAAEAATVAREAAARRLLIGHFSARYPDPAPLVEEARAVFQNTEAAEELNRYPLSEPSV